MLKDLSDVVVFSSEVQYHHLSTDVRFCRVDLQRTQNNVVKMSDSRKMWKFCCVFFCFGWAKAKKVQRVTSRVENFQGGETCSNINEKYYQARWGGGE